MSNETNLGANSGLQTGASAIGQTANIGRSTSVSSGAAKVFREFKWGLLTLFLLMVVVVGLVYDGGRQKKRQADAGTRADNAAPAILLDGVPETGTPPVVIGPTGQPAPAPVPPAPPVAPPVNTAPVIEDPTYAPAPAPLPPTNTPPSAPDARLAQGNPRPTPPAGTSAPPPAPAPTAEKTYTVKSGDTLTSIAAAHVAGKGGIKAILEANKDALSNPDRLRVGMVLKIPSVAAAQKPESTSGTTAEAPTAPAPKEIANAYTVQNGDTLERIARKLYNDGRKWRDLYEWNRDQLSDPGRLRAGQVLKIKQTNNNTASTLPPAGSPRAEGTSDNVQAPVSASATTQSAQPEVMTMSSSASLP